MIKKVCIALLVLSSPALAQELTSSGFYIGAHVSSANGASQDEDAVSNEFDIDTSGKIGGVILGHVWSYGSINFAIEGDIGFGLIDGTYRGGDYTDTYSTRLNGHLRSKLGYELSERLNVFVAGGFSAASHTYAYDYDVGNAESDTQLLLGWTVGAGVGFEILQGTFLNVEAVHDNYGKKEYFFPEADIHEDAGASANLLRISIIREF